jgi:hypothetical protein
MGGLKMAKIELRGVPHRRVAVADIEKNPHRNLTQNPVSEERVEQLLGSFERSGFWDNIVVREHPTKDGKYQLAYGHNRLAALKKPRVEVGTITIPVAKLTDWEMYCAMVDENEMQGTITPAIAMENVNVGCDIIERGLKTAGKGGTWEEFNEAIGRVVSAGTTRSDNGHGFEQVRNAFFAGEGLGRAFVTDFLPGGHLRSNTLSTILSARYDEGRAAAAEKKADEKEKEAKEKHKQGKSEAAQKAEEEAKKLRQEAKRLGLAVPDRILRMFSANRTMSDFAAAVKKLGISKDLHEEAARYIIAQKVTEERIYKELDVWWDERSGAAEARRKDAKRKADMEKFKERAKGRDFNSFVVKFAESVKNLQADAKEIIKAAELVDQYSWKAIEKDVIPTVEILEHLIEQTRAAFLKMKDITPATKMLSHQRS